MPRLLDLFCGAGGASEGYYRAGFDVVGVDLKPQPHYPFTFYHGDALDWPLGPFDVVHASPPCQSFSRTRKIMEGKGIPNPRAIDLISVVRERLVKSGKPYVIENVPGAPLLSPVLLCGTMFGLKVYRHRLFELSHGTVVRLPAHPKHEHSTGSHRGYSKGFPFVTVGGHNYNVGEGKRAMGIGWMTRDELNEAIPPAYTERIGRLLLGKL